MKQQDELSSLIEVVKNSESKKISGRILTLGINFYVFDRNYQEIMKFSDWIEKPEQIMRLWDPKNRNELDVVINEESRLLHNYLASAKSLVDHTRVVINDWYENTEFLKEYDVQIKQRFQDNPVIGFIEEFRNYILHYAIPLTSAAIIMDNRHDGIESSFKIDKESLEEWEGWTNKGKAFFEEIQDDIDIKILVTEYYQQIFKFHRWLEQRMREIHSKELSWLSDMNKKIISLMDNSERMERGL